MFDLRKQSFCIPMFEFRIDIIKLVTFDDLEQEIIMKQLFAVLSAAAILVSAAPAFACGGDKANKEDHSSADTVMTANEDGHECNSECDHDKKKAKKAKKEQSTEEADGEV